MNTKNRKELEHLLSLSPQQLKTILIQEISEDRILEIEKSVRKLLIVVIETDNAVLPFNK